MRTWWAQNAESREPYTHAAPEAFGLELDAVRPLFATYVEHSHRWLAKNPKS
jgi:hypothetical protein